jgi:hypothetical protein
VISGTSRGGELVHLKFQLTTARATVYDAQDAITEQFLSSEA